MSVAASMGGRGHANRLVSLRHDDQPCCRRYHLRRGSQSTQQDEEEQFTQHTTHKPHDNSSLHTLVGIGRIHPQRGLEEFTRLLLLNSTSQARRVTLAASAVQETACLGCWCGDWKNSPTQCTYNAARPHRLLDVGDIITYTQQPPPPPQPPSPLPHAPPT